MTNVSLGLVLFSVLLTVIAQLLLKKGALNLNVILATSENLPQILWGLIGNYALLGGLTIYGLSAITWIFALTKVNVSLAYPFVGLGIVGTTVAGYLVFNEQISNTAIIGICLVVIGLMFIAKA